VKARWLITNGVYVITANWNDRLNGMAAAWVTRIAAEPVLVAVAIWHENFTYELVRRSGAFAVNILGEGQQELGRWFGRRSGREVDKFSKVKYRLGPTGSPILVDALAYLDCKVIFQRAFGDHTLFVGEVVEEGIQREGAPLVYRHEDYFAPEEGRV